MICGVEWSAEGKNEILMKYFAVNQNNTNFAMQTASRSPVGSCGTDARHFVKEIKYIYYQKTDIEYV